MLNTFEDSRGNYFVIWELDYEFIVVVDGKSYICNTVADVKDFIQYYDLNNEEEEGLC